MLHSNFRRIGEVTFPAYQARQHYMHTFDAARPTMAAGFEDYHHIATTLLHRAGVVSGPVHMTVDEKIVQPGMSQRRPRPHVDGCFVPELGRWGNGGWLHGCNNVGMPIKRMAIIVAATVPGCRAWRGEFDGVPADDGDLSHIAGQLKAGVVLPANWGWLLSPDCVHESMTFEKPTQRQFLRLAFAAL